MKFRDRELPDAEFTALVGIAALIITFVWLVYLTTQGQFVNQAGFLVGLYSIGMAFYLQFSPRLQHPLAVYDDVEYRVPITLYMIGAASVFSAIRIIEIDAATSIARVNPMASAIANSIIVALVTGWVVRVYLLKLGPDRIEEVADTLTDDDELDSPDGEVDLGTDTE